MAHGAFESLQYHSGRWWIWGFDECLVYQFSDPELSIPEWLADWIFLVIQNHYWPWSKGVKKFGKWSVKKRNAVWAVCKTVSSFLFSGTFRILAFRSPPWFLCLLSVSRQKVGACPAWGQTITTDCTMFFILIFYPGLWLQIPAHTTLLN